MVIACPSCEQDNAEGARFCSACGTGLERICPRCEDENPPGARFCNGCGCSLDEANPPSPRDYTPRHLADKILTQRSALEGERKRVTVLFADVKGSLELAGQVDPEIWHRILDGFFEILADGVHALEGTINQYTGDGVMALFGAPIAHEDHAQRACYAALRLRDALREFAREVKREHGIGFSTRMGVHSGEVIVGKIGDDLRMDYTAQGHTVGLAARMEELASPDTCYISGDTANLVRGYFDLEDLGRFPVKGLDTDVPVYQLQGLGDVKSRFDVSRARGLSRFVGRDADMRTVEAAFEQAGAGNGQVVGIVAEAGTGKSRLCFEFIERCRARGITVPEGRGVAHGKNLPFLPILQVCRDYYGIHETDSDQTAREKIAGRLLLIDEDFRDALPLLFDFFGVPDPERPASRMDPEARQRQLFGVLRRVFEREDRGEAGVILIEDLHWIDTASDTFLGQWVDAVAGTPTLLLLNFRPEYRADWMQKTYYHQLPLAPLGADAIRELLDDLLGRDASIAGLAEKVHARTGGNPFYAEEVVQSLIESGKLEGSRGAYRLIEALDDLEVPGTVQSVLAARIDRLPEREKQVLQTAAVIGKEFSEPILDAVAKLPKVELEAALLALKQGEFVHEQSLYPVAEYTFKHPLTQEVALGSQLQERRARIHGDVARAVEERLSGQEEKLEESAALLAHHWEGAGELLQAALWHRRAAEWVSNNDFAAARRHWTQVRELAAAVPVQTDVTLDLRAHACTEILALAWRLGLPEEEAAAVFREGKSLVDQLDAETLRGDLYGHRCVTLYLTGQLHAAEALNREIRALFERAKDRGARAYGWLGTIIDVSQIRGDFSEGIAICDELMAGTEHDLRLGVDFWGGSDYAWALCRRGAMGFMQGETAAGRRDMTRGIELGAQLELTEMIGFMRYFVVTCAEIAGEAVEALSHSQELARIADRIGSSLSIVMSSHASAVTQLANGSVNEALELWEFALSLARERRTGLHLHTELLRGVSMGGLATGDAKRALEFAEEAVAMGASQGAKLYEVLAQLQLCAVLRRTEGSGARDAIEGALARSQQLVDDMGARLVQPLLHTERSELARLRGDGVSRESELRIALALWEELECPVRADGLRSLLNG